MGEAQWKEEAQWNDMVEEQQKKETQQKEMVEAQQKTKLQMECWKFQKDQFVVMKVKVEVGG